MKTKSKPTFAARLKALRARTGLSQAALAAVSGLSSRYISMLECGQRTPKRMATLLALANGLGAKSEELWP